jgi:1,5-anhydro-D-fructose reductase (1,5-anhydro-D-mannitol-forming)
MVHASNAQPDSRVVAVRSSDPVRARAFAATHDIPQAHETVEGLLADPAVDIVYISTTNDKPQPLTLAAAAAGKHVLCEKPLALSVAGAQEMVAVCRAAGVVLGTNHHLRNSAFHRTLRDRIKAGAIGEPLAARVFHAVYLPVNLQGWRVADPAAGGGVILDITVHDADTLRFVLDDNPQEVTALTASQGMATTGLPDAVMGVMRFHRGTLVQFHDAFTIRHARTGFEVHGTEGSLIGVNCMTQEPVGALYWQRGSEREEIDVDPHENLYERSVRAYNAAVLGKRSPAATGEDGVWSLATALAAAESAATGQVVKLQV